MIEQLDKDLKIGFVKLKKIIKDFYRLLSYPCNKVFNIDILFFVLKNKIFLINKYCFSILEDFAFIPSPI